jgi:hypothetical protein
VPEIQIIITRLERQRAAIEKAIEALWGINNETVSANRGSGTRSRATASPTDGRQRQIDAMRRYWAERKAGGKKAAAKKAARKGGITPEGRKRLSEMMRKRWAARKEAEAATQVSLPAKAKRRKRRLTPEGRERIAEATRRRWAAKRAADAAAQATGKKTVR